MSWTHERIEQLKKLWEAGYTASNIATELGGITRNAVIGKAHRLGLSGRMKSKSKVSSVSIVRKRKMPVNKNSKIIELTTSVEPMNPTSFADIKDGLCRWPLGEPEDLDFKFCGRKCAEGMIYCTEHHSLAYQPLNQTRQKRASRKRFKIG
ncbi:GcrA family cell cycle regulator [Pelagibacteraceae bacterium]|jgi:GcrA cell cycle regulator|nr:GcrA family cell cycle regulator [Pelagibacteraceae bacterium]MDC3172001.1 GcrA family cell cycle regulator [Pelagibacteraceae bacterium]|tara:strand:- start:163 stop:615 length:453 start_codon:yes stop_codon:yes gene_type:complete